MIPAIIPPLTGLSVLVTRPLPQAERLAAWIETHGGEAHVLPAIAIKPVVAQLSSACDLVIFVSVNAVEHGIGFITRSEGMRIAAIGNATAAALRAAGWNVDVVPERGFTSEALLAHPELRIQSGTRVLIVRGQGGRELLREAFTAQGCVVDTLEVYERSLPAIDPLRRDQVETLWAAGDIHVVTATSVESLTNLRTLLSERGNALLAESPLVVPSPRVASMARELGLRGDCIVADGADDEATINALARWHARARMPSIAAAQSISP
jgi:uroporphyrinogen-III synthase